MFTFKKCIIFLCVILSVGEVWSAQPLGYEYVPGADGWLRLHSAPATWPDALLRCTLEGGIIASPSSSAIASAMKLKMAAQQQTTKVFIGIHASLSSEEYVSLDGVPFSDMPLTWAKGQPDNQDNIEQCLVMTNTGEVADWSCSKVFRYFCFKKSHSENVEYNQNAPECNTTDSEYKLDARTGSCYKFHAITRTWPEAAKACRSAHAHLAVINSETEAQVLTELFDQHTVESLRSVVMNPYMVLIGFRKEHGEWLTIFDETLSDAGFAKWSPNEPNNENGRELCGTMHRSGQLNDYNCDIAATYICEMKTTRYNY